MWRFFLIPILFLLACQSAPPTPTATPRPIPIGTTAGRGGAVASPSATVGPRTYTVKAGDTLQSIAQEIYGDATRANLIFEANRDQIKDADAIQVGMVLKIPPPP